MKSTSTLLTLAVCGLIGFTTACSKKNEPASAPTPPAAETPKPLTTLPGEAAKALQEQKAAVEKAAADVKTQAQDAAAKTSAQAQGLLDQAKGFVADKKYQDALNLLQQLSGMVLTPEQQQMVSGLKTQVQQLMAGQAASEATKSVGSLPGLKK